MGSTASTFTRAVKNSLGSASTKFTKSNHLVYYDRIIDRTKFLYRWYSELRADACAFTKDEDVINKCPGNVPEVEWVVLNGQNAEGSLNIWEIEAFDTNGIELNFGTGSVIDGQSSTNVKTCYDGKSLSPNTCTSKYLKTEWAFSITSQDITQSVGAAVTQGTSTGTLKTALTGAGMVNVIINAAAGVTFITTADITIGNQRIVHAKVNSATYKHAYSNSWTAAYKITGGKKCIGSVAITPTEEGLATFKKGKTKLQLKKTKDGVSELDIDGIDFMTSVQFGSKTGRMNVLIAKDAIDYSTRICLPPSTSTAEAGITTDAYYGWYDVQGCGKCNDYCRWIGSSSGGDPKLILKAASSYWSCRKAGDSTTHTQFDQPNENNYYGKPWNNFIKCSGAQNKAGGISVDEVGPKHLSKLMFNLTRPTFGTNRAWKDKTYKTIKYESPCMSEECAGPVSYKYEEMLVSKNDSNACHLKKRHYCAGKRTSGLLTKALDPGCFPSMNELNIKTVMTDFSKDTAQSSSPYFSQDCTFTPFGQGCYNKKLHYCAYGSNSYVLKSKNNVGCFAKNKDSKIVGPNIVYTSTTCNFDIERMDSPCHELECIKTPESNKCREYILDYCAINNVVNSATKDFGCFQNIPVVGFNNCKTIGTQDSPCYSPACSIDETSTECWNDRNTFCEALNKNENITKIRPIKCEDSLRRLNELHASNTQNKYNDERQDVDPKIGQLFRAKCPNSCTYNSKLVFGTDIYAAGKINVNYEGTFTLSRISVNIQFGVYFLIRLSDTSNVNLNTGDILRYKKGSGAIIGGLRDGGLYKIRSIDNGNEVRLGGDRNNINFCPSRCNGCGSVNCEKWCSLTVSGKQYCGTESKHLSGSDCRGCAEDILPTTGGLEISITKVTDEGNKFTVSSSLGISVNDVVKYKQGSALCSGLSNNHRYKIASIPDRSVKNYKHEITLKNYLDGTTINIANDATSACGTITKVSEGSSTSTFTKDQVGSQGSSICQAALHSGLDLKKEFVVAVVRGRHQYPAGKAVVNPDYTVSVSKSVVSSATSTTVTHSIGMRAFVVGDVVTIFGHTGDSTHEAMNQKYTVSAVTKATVVVLTGSGMTAGSYDSGTIIAVWKISNGGIRVSTAYTTSLDSGNRQRTPFAFTVRQNSGCDQKLQINTANSGNSNCDNKYDNTNPSSPCLNQICWNKGDVNKEGDISGTTCLDVQRNYCKSNIVSTSTHTKDKACFLLQSGAHKSECPFDWGLLKDSNNDETVSPCHAHQCFETTKGLGKYQTSPRPLSHPSRLAACASVVKKYCDARPWEPYCFAATTTRFPALDLGLLGCENLFFTGDSQASEICRSPACTPHSSQVHLLMAPVDPVRYIKITPTSDGTRGIFEFRGVSAPFVYPKVTSGIENDLQVVGNVVMEHKTSIKGPARIRLDVESDWSKGAIHFIELTPVSFNTSLLQSPCDMPSIQVNYAKQEWTVSIDGGKQVILLKTQTKGVGVIVLDHMTFSKKEEIKYFETRDLQQPVPVSMQRFPVALHSAFPERTFNDGSSGVLSRKTGAVWTNDRGWKVESGTNAWVRFVPCLSLAHDSYTSACMEPLLENATRAQAVHTIVDVHIKVNASNVFTAEFSLSYRGHPRDSQQASWKNAGSTNEITFMDENMYIIYLGDVVAHGAEWRVNIKDLNKNIVITEIVMYSHKKSFVSSTNEDGTAAITMATYLDTIDASDIVVIAAPYGSQYAMGSKAMDALKRVGVTPLEAAALTPWSSVGRKAKEAVRVTTPNVFSTQRQPRENIKKETVVETTYKSGKLGGTTLAMFEHPSEMKCKTGGSWTRLATDVANSKAGVEDCAARCLARGDAYFSLECPRTTAVHCQCARSKADLGSKADDSECKQTLFGSSTHCVGPYVADGYALGGHSHGSVYSTKHNSIPHFDKHGGILTESGLILPNGLINVRTAFVDFNGDGNNDVVVTALDTTKLKWPGRYISDFHIEKIRGGTDTYMLTNRVEDVDSEGIGLETYNHQYTMDSKAKDTKSYVFAGDGAPQVLEQAMKKCVALGVDRCQSIWAHDQKWCPNFPNCLKFRYVVFFFFVTIQGNRINTDDLFCFLFFVFSVLFFSIFF